MIVPLDVLWFILALVISAGTLIGILNSAVCEGLLLDLPAYKESPHLRLRFFIMTISWVIPALIGVVACLANAAYLH